MLEVKNYLLRLMNGINIINIAYNLINIVLVKYDLYKIKNKHRDVWLQLRKNYSHKICPIVSMCAKIENIMFIIYFKFIVNNILINYI